MAFRVPPDPYDLLVQRLLENVELTRQATERGFQALREERLVEEERAFQREQRQQERAWQEADYLRQRNDRLTEQAMVQRAAQASAYQNLIGYITPEHEDYALHQAALRALSQPLNVEGEEAWELVNSGRLVVDIDGQPTEVSVYNLLGSAMRIRDETQLQDEWDANMVAHAIQQAFNTELDMSVRLGYVNGVLNNPDIRQSLKQRLVDMVIEDPERRQDVLTERRIREADLRKKELEIFGLSTTIAQDIERFGWERDWHEWDFARAQRQWEMDQERFAQEMVTSDLEAFNTIGFLPPPERREALAARLGLSVDELEQRAAENFARFQRDQRNTSRALELSLNLTEVQIDVAKLQRDREQLSIDRERMFGVLNDRVELAGKVAAAAADGRVEEIEALIALRDAGLHNDVLGTMGLDSFLNLAQQVRSDQDHMRNLAKQQLELAVEQANRGNVLDIESFYETVAAYFLWEDFTVDENGSRPALEAAVRQWARGMNQNTIESLGATSLDEVVDRVVRAAVMARDRLDRDQATARLTALLQAPWPEDPASQARMRAAIHDAAMQTGLWTPEEIDPMLDGLADAANRDVLKWKAEVAETNQRADLAFSQTFLNFFQTLGTNGQAAIDLTSFTKLHDIAMAQVDRAINLMNGAKCGITVDASNFVMAGETFNSDNPDCVQAYEDWRRWYDIGDWLGTAIIDGGMALLTGPVPDGVPGVPEGLTESGGWRPIAPRELRALVVEAYGERADEFNVANFYALPPEMQHTVRMALEAATDPNLDPEARSQLTVDAVNDTIVAALVELDAERGFIPEPRGLPSFDDVLASFAREQTARGGEAWADLSPEARLPYLERSQEWMELATDVANRQVKLTDDQMADYAVRFGFVRPVPVREAGRQSDVQAARGVAVWLARLLYGYEAEEDQFGAEEGQRVNVVPVIDDFKRALNATIDNRLIPARDRRLRQAADRATGFDPAPGQPLPSGPEPAPGPRPPLNVVPRPVSELPMGAEGPTGFREALGILPQIPGVRPATERGSGLTPELMPGGGGGGTSGYAPFVLQKVAATPPSPGPSSDRYAWDSWLGQAQALLPALVQQESGGNHFGPDGRLLRNPASGALGITQVMPATGRNPGYGVTPLRGDSEQEYLRFGRDYLAAMLEEFDGDLTKALAAYNWGPGNVERAIREYGSNWFSHAPVETQRYVNNVLFMYRTATRPPT